MSYWVTPNITLIITGRAGLAWQTDWYLVRTPLYSHLQLLQLNPPSALLLLCKALNSSVTPSEEWLYFKAEDPAILINAEWHCILGLTTGLVLLAVSPHVIQAWVGISEAWWCYYQLANSIIIAVSSLPPPYWDNDRWCRYCVCRQVDKNMREPRWKVSRLGFDNFIMTSQACFVVITVRPELGIDLYSDRHLTPTTQAYRHTVTE